MEKQRPVDAPASGIQPCPAAVSDAELLGRFVSQRDESAFAALMARHGPMVFGVCRRLLRHVQDAEDAFQATFLVLARKAAQISRRKMLANWLYGVAVRVAARVRFTARQRRTHETADMEHIALATREPSEATDLSVAVAEEVQRLPAKYRGPIILCYLEGRTNEEAAAELRWPLGTVKGRLARAREMLRKRLSRRGLALSTAVFSTALFAEASAASLPPVLIDSTLKAAVCFAAGDAAAGGLVSAQAAALTKGVLHTMFVTKMKIVAVVVLALAMLVGGVGAFAYHRLAAEAEGKNKDKENIQGTWKVESMKRDGRNVELKSDVEIVITADKWTVRVGGEITTEPTYKIDPKAKPKTIDVIHKDGVEMGIYKLEGDKLTISYCNANKKESPKDFACKAGSNETLSVLKRVKK